MSFINAFDILLAARIFGSIRKIFGYRFFYVDEFEDGADGKKSKLYRIDSHLDLAIKFTYSPKYGIDFDDQMDSSFPLVGQMDKSLRRLMSQCSNLKSKLFSLMDHFNWMDKLNGRHAFFFDTNDQLIYLNYLPKNINKSVLKARGLGSATKLTSTDLFISNALRQFISTNISTLKIKNIISPIYEHSNISFRMAFGGKSHKCIGYLVIIDETVLKSIESDPQNEREQTKELFLERKVRLRIKRMNRCKKAGVTNLDNKIGPLYYANGGANESGQLNKDGKSLDEFSPKQSIERLHKVSEKTFSKAWSLHKIVNNHNDENNELTSNFKSKGLQVTQKDLLLENVSKSYATEYFPENFDPRTQNTLVRVDKLMQTSSLCINNPEGTSKAISKPSQSEVNQIISLVKNFNHDVLTDWNFDIIKLDPDNQMALTYKIFGPYLTEFSIQPSLFLSFAYGLRTKYNKLSNPFHNFTHGVAVAFSSNFILTRLPQLKAKISPAIQYAFLIAAFGHDAAHTGKNNVYEINSRSKLALRYNDRSPLEQHHIATLFSLVFKYKLNIFEQFTSEAFNEMRNTIIECILATDMKVHFSLLKKFEGAIQSTSSLALKDLKELVLCILIHAADISASTRKIEIASQWSRLVAEEFSNQYNLEVKQELPVTPYFKDLHVPLNFYKSEVGFLNFIVKPLFQSLQQYSFDLGEPEQKPTSNQECENKRTEIGDLMSNVIQKTCENPFNQIMGHILDNIKYYEDKIENLGSQKPNQH